MTPFFFGSLRHLRVAEYESSTMIGCGRSGLRPVDVVKISELGPSISLHQHCYFSNFTYCTRLSHILKMNTVCTTLRMNIVGEEY
jgi:hypothetical protein